MVSLVALLCAAGIARSDCSPDNAIDVIPLPAADNEMICLQQSMMTLAALAIRAGPGEYWKVVCVSAADKSPPVAQAPQPDLPLIAHTGTPNGGPRP
jgi:hypothetical protein